MVGEMRKGGESGYCGCGELGRRRIPWRVRVIDCSSFSSSSVSVRLRCVGATLGRDISGMDRFDDVSIEFRQSRSSGCVSCNFHPLNRVEVPVSHLTMASFVASAGNLRGVISG